MAYAPSFEALEKLAHSRDRDVFDAQLAAPRQVRGRGAQSNTAGRYEREARMEIDDGWERDDPLPPMRTNVHTERATTIISRNDSPDLPFERSINPYRGCEHGCSYCFARQTHAYLGHSPGLDFEREIYVKVNAPDVLRRELSAKRYKPKVMAIGTNTDPYQPVERDAKIMRGVLEVLAETRHPVQITTKSALIVRDLDLLTELARHGLVSVAISVTSLDAHLSRSMEPRASTPSKRLEAIRLLAAAGVPTLVSASPMVPALNDMELERILDAAAAQGASSASMILLRLPGEVRALFREWLLRHYPDRLRHVMQLVRDTRGGKEYDARFGARMQGEGPYAVLLRQRFDKAKIRYGLDTKPAPLRTDLFSPPQVDDPQLNLF